MIAYVETDAYSPLAHPDHFRRFITLSPLRACIIHGCLRSQHLERIDVAPGPATPVACTAMRDTDRVVHVHTVTFMYKYDIWWYITIKLRNVCSVEYYELISIVIPLVLDEPRRRRWKHAQYQ